MRPALALPVALLAFAACSSNYGTGPGGGGALETPTALVSVSLNTAVQLSWDPNARLANPSRFEHYNVYSTSYDLDRGVCDTNGWALEGTSVSEDFLVSGLTNGVPLCFAVSSVSTSGNESAVSSYRNDTPRYDSRNVLVSTAQSDLSSSGFRFDFNPSSPLGQVVAGDRSDIDFRVDRHSDGSIWLSTVRNGTSVVLYSQDPVQDLTSIDIAPLNGYITGSIEAVPGYAYVFETVLSDGLHYGAVRITHTSRDYVILDWAYQTDFGNPELRLVR
ncbi:MAG: hypothetical protein JWO39_118 [Gemmatimonadetes bacterium]|jgi:hypothetical protein|nr:hypothetical protein [Gemmatimonadota bacterium]